MSRCSRCPGVSTCLEPQGPDSATILIIGEYPGKDENRRGQILTGKVGQELDRHYLPLAGLRREQVVMAYALGCMPATNGGKLDVKKMGDAALLETCASERLHTLIETGRFSLLVPLGNLALRTVCSGVEIELSHGIPRTSQWGIPVFPMFHPGLGIHEPKKMLHIRTDWHRLRAYCKGTLRVPVDAYPTPDYREVTDAVEIDSLDVSLPLAIDTESTRKKEPYCLTYSQRPGTGRLVRAGNSAVLERLGQRLRSWRSHLLFHNLLYDEPIVRAMGVSGHFQHYVDTMAEVYHLGNLPQGLKALAFRELGMTMEDFEDVIGPHSKKRVVDFYKAAASLEWEKPEEETRYDNETGRWKLYRPQGMATKFKRFFTDYRKNPAKDIFNMWSDNWKAYQEEIERRVGGEFPGMCITHAPFEQVLHYACRDADATLRLYLNVITPMQRRVRKFSQELWRA